MNLDQHTHLEWWRPSYYTILHSSQSTVIQWVWNQCCPVVWYYNTLFSPLQVKLFLHTIQEQRTTKHGTGLIQWHGKLIHLHQITLFQTSEAQVHFHSLQEEIIKWMGMEMVWYSDNVSLHTVMHSFHASSAPVTPIQSPITENPRVKNSGIIQCHAQNISYATLELGYHTMSRSKHLLCHFGVGVSYNVMLKTSPMPLWSWGIIQCHAQNTSYATLEL